jgi:hypothetical protein
VGVSQYCTVKKPTKVPLTQAGRALVALFLIVMCFPHLRDFKVVFIIPGYLVLLFIDELFFGGTIKYPTFSSDVVLFVGILFSIAIYLAIGAFFGWVYGKIKKVKV